MATEPALGNRPAGRGTCPRCNQNRVLWSWSPAHQQHWDEATRLRCPWCQAVANGASVLLCLDCCQAETRREQETPLDPADVTVLRLVAAQSGPEPAAAPYGAERRAS